MGFVNCDKISVDCWAQKEGQNEICGSELVECDWAGFLSGVGAVRSGSMGRFVRGDEQKVTTKKSEFLIENFL